MTLFVLAPLACEGSIRLLRSAYNNSTELMRLKKHSDPYSQANVEQIPFANDNCGTIRNREASRYVPGTSSFQQKMSKSTLSNVFAKEADTSKRYSIFLSYSPTVRPC